jgi:hypothetical protein
LEDCERVIPSDGEVKHRRRMWDLRHLKKGGR